MWRRRVGRQRWERLRARAAADAGAIVPRRAHLGFEPAVVLRERLLPRTTNRAVLFCPRAEGEEEAAGRDGAG